MTYVIDEWYQRVQFRPSQEGTLFGDDLRSLEDIIEDALIRQGNQLERVEGVVLEKVHLTMTIESATTR